MPNRKGWKQLPQEAWLKIRASYENDPNRPTLVQLAKAFDVHSSTICLRAKAEKWHRNGDLALAVINSVENSSDAIVAQTTASVANQLTKHLNETLQPWLEKEKTRHIRTQVRRSKLALSQLDQHISKHISLSPKDSSFVAKTAETWDNIMRRSLGMNDSQPVGTNLTLNVLTNHAAVKVESNEKLVNEI